MIRLALRVIHCADLHLSHFHRARALRILQSLAALESSFGADVVLIAGDIFDGTGESPEFIDDVAAGLLSFRSPIVAVPGNHDVPFKGQDPTGRLFSLLGEKGMYMTSLAGRFLDVASGRLCIWGRGMPEHSPDNDPLSGFQPMEADGRWNVVLAHGQLQLPGKMASGSSPISLARYGPALGNVHYVALGHAHGPTQRAFGRTIIRDSGAATSIGGSGTATLIEFDRQTGLTITSHLVDQ